MQGLRVITCHRGSGSGLLNTRMQSYFVTFHVTFQFAVKYHANPIKANTTRPALLLIDSTCIFLATCVVDVSVTSLYCMNVCGHTLCRLPPPGAYVSVCPPCWAVWVSQPSATGDV